MKTLAGVFRTIRFIPTDGITTANLSNFLVIPSVLACGGSWLTPETHIQSGDFDTISTLAKGAVLIVRDSEQSGNFNTPG